MKLEKAIGEIDEIYEFYKDSDSTTERECYDKYVYLIINNSIPRHMRKFHKGYWEGLKDEVRKS